MWSQARQLGRVVWRRGIDPGPLLNQFFVVEFFNNAGTIQHAIYEDNANVTAPINGLRVNGASATRQNTPTVNATTDFTTGVGLVSGTGGLFVLDTGPLAVGDLMGLAVVESYLSNVVRPRVAIRLDLARNVNGTTRTRLAANLYTDAGAQWNINTTNIAASDSIKTRFCVYLP